MKTVTRIRHARPQTQADRAFLRSPTFINPINQTQCNPTTVPKPPPRSKQRSANASTTSAGRWHPLIAMCGVKPLLNLFNVDQLNQAAPARVTRRWTRVACEPGMRQRSRSMWRPDRSTTSEFLRPGRTLRSAPLSNVIKKVTQPWLIKVQPR